MMEKKLEDMIGKNIEGKMEQEIEKQIQTTIGDKMKQMIDAKISEKLGKKIEEKIDEKIEMLGERIEEMIEEKMEDKLKKLMEGKINATIEEQIEKHGNDIMEKMNEVMEEKIEEGVEEKIEGKIQETIEEKMEGTIEKIEKELRSKIKEKTADKTEEMRDGQSGNARKEDEWTTARGGGKRKRSYTERDGQIKLSNRFKVLDPEVQSEKEDVRYLVIGDSRVRAIEKVMCGHRDKCVMKPGGKVEEMEAILKEELGKCDPEVIILNVGVNNVGPRRSVRLEEDYLALLRKLREARKPTVITGILPRAAAGNE